MHDEITHMMGSHQSEMLWQQIWLFGIIVDDDLDYYVPDDEDTTVSLITLDGPRRAI